MQPNEIPSIKLINNPFIGTTNPYAISNHFGSNSW